MLSIVFANSILDCSLTSRRIHCIELRSFKNYTLGYFLFKNIEFKSSCLPSLRVWILQPRLHPCIPGFIYITNWRQGKLSGAIGKHQKVDNTLGNEVVNMITKTNVDARYRFSFNNFFLLEPKEIRKKLGRIKICWRDATWRNWNEWQMFRLPNKSDYGFDLAIHPTHPPVHRNFNTGPHTLIGYNNYGVLGVSYFIEW